MLVSGLAVPIRILTMVVGRGGVLLRLVVVAMVVVMGRLVVVMGRGLVVRGGVVMMLAGNVFLFLCHVKFLLPNEVRDVSGQKARQTAVTDFTDNTESQKMPVSPFRTNYGLRSRRSSRRSWPGVRP